MADLRLHFENDALFFVTSLCCHKKIAGFLSLLQTVRHSERYDEQSAKVDAARYKCRGRMFFTDAERCNRLTVLHIQKI